MSNKTLNNATLELTQKIQMHFPRDIDPEILRVWNGQSKEKITAVAMEIFGRLPQKPSILEFIGTVKIPATTEKFIAEDRFVIDRSDSAPVKIFYLGDNFKKWFLGKIEKPIEETILRCQKLRKSSVDDLIIAELGGKKKAETTLTEMFSLMERQPNDEDGILLTNGIFYIRDINGVLCAVGCGWDGGGWLVYASSVDASVRWFGGSQVFSRNPSESQS